MESKVGYPQVVERTRRDENIFVGTLSVSVILACMITLPSFSTGCLVYLVYFTFLFTRRPTMDRESKTIIL